MARKGKRRSAQTQHARNEARFKRQMAAKRRYADLLKEKSKLIQEIRDRDAQRLYEYKTLYSNRRLHRRGTKEERVFKGSAYYLAKDGSAQRARSKTAPSRPRKAPPDAPTYAVLERPDRNSWSYDPCVKRPDSVKAGKRRQEMRRQGKAGQSTYKPRRWC